MDSGACENPEQTPSPSPSPTPSQSPSPTPSPSPSPTPSPSPSPSSGPSPDPDGDDQTPNPTTSPGDGDGPGPGSDEGDDESSISGSGCENAPSCDGDPIQCYLANKNWEQACALSETVEDEEVETAFDDALLDGKDELLEKFDENDFTDIMERVNPSKACFSNHNITLGDLGGYTLKFEKLCFLFQIIGYLVLASAYKAVALMYFQAFAGG